MPTLRGAFDAGGDRFNFATPVSKKSCAPDGDGGTEYGTWIQRVKASYDYFGRSSDLKFGAWTRRTARHHGGSRDPYGEELRGWRIAGNHRDLSMLDADRLKGITQPEDDHSGDTSPTLWEKAASPKARPVRLVPIYPGPQAQAVAKYRQEMMELVKGVPESVYELSLRDIVEVPMMAKPEEDDVKKERGASEAESPVTQRDKKDQKKHKSGKKRIQRSSSLDSGVFLLKMFFLPYLGGRRKSAPTGSGSRVLPKPTPSDGEKGSMDKSMEAEWSEGRNEMSRGRSNSNDRRSKKIGCYPFSINMGKIR